MSAYVVDRAHIDAIVGTALCPTNHGGSGLCDPDTGRILDLSDADWAGVELWSENLRSVAYRYPDDVSGERPGPVDLTDEEVYAYTFPKDWQRFRILTAVETLKAIRGLEYQSCEHPEWETSWAYKFLQMLEARAMHELPGYAEADWEIREVSR
jgi:hypothetical protein